MPNFVILWQEVCEISAVENLCSWKNGPKSLKTCYASIPQRCQIWSRSDKENVRHIRCGIFLLPGKVRQSSPKSLRIWYPPIPPKLQNLVGLRQKCPRYPLLNICVPEKMDDSSPTHKCPSSRQVSWCSVKRCTRKALDIFWNPSVFWHTRRTLEPKYMNLASDVHQGPLHQADKFQSVLKTPLRDDCCQSLSISSVAWPLPPHTHHAATNKYLAT